MYTCLRQFNGMLAVFCRSSRRTSSKLQYEAAAQRRANCEVPPHLCPVSADCKACLLKNLQCEAAVLEVQTVGCHLYVPCVCRMPRPTS